MTGPRLKGGQGAINVTGALETWSWPGEGAGWRPEFQETSICEVLKQEESVTEPEK